MKTILTILGAAMVLMGLLWMGQGLGVIRWPASSFMIDVSDWVWRGALFALGGLLLIWAGRRR